MSLWQDTVNTALVGSERQTLTLVVPPESKLAQMMSQLDPSASEAYLLKVAAILSAYRKGTWMPKPKPQMDLQPVDPCSLDDQPVCSHQSTQLLEMILTDRYRDLLPEWLTLLAQAQQRIPETKLPQLLDLGQKHPTLQSQIMPVLGQRGQWLATYNQNWNYACVVKALDPSLWQTGTQSQRLALLVSVNQQDPNQARQLLQSTWKQEPADFRADCLSVLESTLSPEDEPWLELIRCQDRSKQVRSQAINLLGRLPGSALCQRLGSRVKPLLQLVQTADTPILRVELPDQLTPEMEQDGITKTPPSRMGEKAWWLQQMLGKISPQVWCDQWQMTPDQLLVCLEPESVDLVTTGWVTATCNFQAIPWALALLRFTVHQEFAGGLYLYPAIQSQAERLAHSLTAEALQALCIEFLQDPNPQTVLQSHTLGKLLICCQTPWSLALTRAFADRFRQDLETDPNLISEYWLQSVWMTAGTYSDPSQRDYLIGQGIDPFFQQYSYRRLAEQVQDRLEFRQILHQSFANHAT